MESIHYTEWWQIANTLQKQGLNSDEITTQLRDKGAPENLLSEIITKIKELHLSQKRNKGFVLCGIGVFLLIVGCLLTFVLFTNGDNIRYVMYGLTSIGVVCAIKGLANITGW